MSFQAIPPEVLEHIAVAVATTPLIGLPVNLLSLIALSRDTHNALAFHKNPHLYARICAAKFDLSAVERRLGKDALSPQALADELVKRCRILKRISSMTFARAGDTELSDESEIDEMLWTAFFMVLENQGLNVAHLRSAHIEVWLNTYWFDDTGASGAVHLLEIDKWPFPGLGASLGSNNSRRCSPHLALAMWLLWFFFDPDPYVKNIRLFRKAEHLLKLIALNAPVYPLTQLPWTSFYPEPSQIHFGTAVFRSDEPVRLLNGQTQQARLSEQAYFSTFTHFQKKLRNLVPPPAATPAILSYFVLAGRSRTDIQRDSIFGVGMFGYDPIAADTFGTHMIGGLENDRFMAFPSAVGQPTAGNYLGNRGFLDSGGLEDSWLLGDPFYPTGFLGGLSSVARVSRPTVKTVANDRRWDCEWERCFQYDPFGLPPGDYVPVRAFKPGSLDGIWEGSFTYTEFHSFAALLAGAKPSKLQDCSVAQHHQTWRIAEHHLLAADSSTSNTEDDAISPLPVGDALLAHMPAGVPVSEDSSGITITVPSTDESSLQPELYFYQRYIPELGARAADREVYRSRVRDIILTGEGHSGWGQFRIMGRVRPYDGFISIMKEYIGGGRGRWLYRGYLVGDGEPPSSGADTPADGSGYIVGRWRDTLTPLETHGYEGAFTLSRRR